MDIIYIKSAEAVLNQKKESRRVTRRENAKMIGTGVLIVALSVAGIVAGLKVIPEYQQEQRQKNASYMNQYVYSREISADEMKEANMDYYNRQKDTAIRSQEEIAKEQERLLEQQQENNNIIDQAEQALMGYNDFQDDIEKGHIK